MGRAEAIPEVLEARPNATHRATEIRRRMNAWGVCHGHPQASLAYSDLCRDVYRTEGRTRLTQDEQESVLKRFNLMGEFNKIMDSGDGKAAAARWSRENRRLN